MSRPLPLSTLSLSEPSYGAYEVSVLRFGVTWAETPESMYQMSGGVEPGCTKRA
jgi:hypothetical protein